MEGRVALTHFQAELAKQFVIPLAGAIVLLLSFRLLPQKATKLSSYLSLAALLVISAYVWLLSNQWKGHAFMDERLHALKIIVIGLALAVVGLQRQYQRITLALVAVAVSTLFLWHVITITGMDARLMTSSHESRIMVERRQMILLLVEVNVLIAVLHFSKLRWKMQEPKPAQTATNASAFSLHEK